MSDQPPAANLPPAAVPIPAPHPPMPPAAPAPDRPLSAPAKAGLGTAVLLTSGRIRLFLAAALFLAWIGWLAVTALTKSRAPTVSHAQAAAAAVPVVAALTTADPNKVSRHVRIGPNGPAGATDLTPAAEKPAFVVKVVEKLHPAGPEPGTEIGVSNLPACTGYTGPGEYLLLLTPDPTATIDGHPAYVLVGQQRSPGADLDGVGPPMIYPWTDKTRDDLRAQVQRLFPPKN
jgi:hypothetical protein